MNAEIAMYMAQVLNTGAFIALAVWYVVPRLRNLSRASALMALTAVHLGRTLALAVYSSQDAGMKMPNAVRDQIVIGDLAGWALALVILFCLHSRLRLSIALIWLLVIETVLDFGSGTIGYIRAGTIGDLNGVPWLIVAFYVTTVEVAVGLTIWQLITRRGEPLFTAVAPLNSNIDGTERIPSRPSASVSRRNPPAMWDMASLGWSHISVAEPGRLAFLSGQIAVTPGSGDAPKDVAGQAKLATTNLAAALKELEASAQDIVMLRVYVVNATSEAFGQAVAPLRELVGDAMPSVTTIGVQALYKPEIKVEIEMVVRLP